jgi:hypothetical protein
MQGPDCLNCGAPLSGRFCAACGQKRIEPEERRLSWFFRALFESALGADGRLRRTIASFLLRPGELGAAWLAGQRTRYLPPLGVFLLVNLVYFVAPPLSDFSLPLADQFGQVGYGAHAKAVVDARLAERGIEMAAYAHRFELEAYSLAKLIIVLHPLLMAPVLALLFLRRRIPLVDHLAIALHLWAMVLLAMMVVPPLAGAVGIAFDAPRAAVMIGFKVALLAVVGGYTGFLLRRAYGASRAWVVPATVLVYVGGAFGHLLVYRPILFYLAFGLS